MPRELAQAAAIEGGFYDETALWIAELIGRAAVILDVGNGAGAAACALAQVFPEAYIVVAHSSREALSRARATSVARGVAERVETCECAPGEGVPDVEPADLVWGRDVVPDAGHPGWTLPQAAALVRQGGTLAWADAGEQIRVLPDDLDVGRPGLLRRLQAAATAGAADDRGAALLDLGLQPATSRRFPGDVAPPLSAGARREILEYLRRLRAQLDGAFDAADLRALQRLLDLDDPRCVVRREDLFYTTNPRVQVAYRTG